MADTIKASGWADVSIPVDEVLARTGASSLDQIDSPHRLTEVVQELVEEGRTSTIKEFRPAIVQQNAD